jgi:hypothetical protein
LIADGTDFTLIASLGFGTTWRWAVVQVDESGGEVAIPPADSTPVCTSAAFTIPACPDSNSDGTCPYHTATPPTPLAPPAWTCSATATPVLSASNFGQIIVVEVTATTSGTVNGWPTIRLTRGGNVASQNYAAVIAFIRPNGGPIAGDIGAGSHASGVAPGTYTVGVYQDPWSFTPVCTNTVTVPPSP